MKNSSKITCSNCEIMGIKQTIGVVLDDGNISIQRSYYKPGYREYTLISGKDFMLTCGKCNNTVYFRKGGENVNRIDGITRFHRQSFIQTTYRVGTQSNYGTA